MTTKRSPTEVFLQISAVTLLAVLCLWVIAPFVTLIVWAIIIAVAVYPAFTKLVSALRGREKLAAASLVLIALAVLVVPTWLMAESTIGATQNIAASTARFG